MCRASARKRMWFSHLGTIVLFPRVVSPQQLPYGFVQESFPMVCPRLLSSHCLPQRLLVVVQLLKGVALNQPPRAPFRLIRPCTQSKKLSEGVKRECLTVARRPYNDNEHPQ